MINIQILERNISVSETIMLVLKKIILVLEVYLYALVFQ